MNEKIEEININDIVLDDENPRIPYSLRNQSEDELLNYLIRTASLVELIKSIGERGFFAGEPLLLVKESEKYVVVEGNRRVSALKLLQDPDKAKELINSIKDAVESSEVQPIDIPAIIFPDRKDISRYLGYRHITGIKNWKALEKARYMNSLYIELVEQGTENTAAYVDIANSIGSKPNYVKRILEAFTLYTFIEKKDFFNIPKLSDETFYFVNLSDSLNKDNIKTFILEDVENNIPHEKHLEEWTKWIFEITPENTTRMKGTSSDLKALNQILGNDYAFGLFRGATVSLKDAELLAEDSEKILNESLNICWNNLQNADRVISKIEDFKLVPNFDKVILDIRQIAKKIYDYKLQQKDTLTDDDDL